MEDTLPKIPENIAPAPDTTPPPHPPACGPVRYDVRQPNPENSWLKNIVNKEVPPQAGLL